MAAIGQETGGGNRSACDLHDGGMSMGLKNNSVKSCGWLLLSAEEQAETNVKVQGLYNCQSLLFDFLIANLHNCLKAFDVDGKMKKMSDVDVG